jgi:hypothetical protein
MGKLFISAHPPPVISKKPHEYGVESKFVLCRYHTPIKGGTLLAITRPQSLNRSIIPGKRKKKKKRNIAINLNKGP